MKIAVATDDSTTISQHYARAKSYLVFTIEDDKTINKEIRDKAGHHIFATRHGEPATGGRRGYNSGAMSRHNLMAQTITDCQVLIAGGMGWGAYHNLKSRNIEPVITDVESIDKAVELYLAGQLPSLMERLH